MRRADVTAGVEAMLVSRTAAAIEPEQIDWLWRDNFALGKVSVVAGASGVGKTLLVAGEFAARVSNGTPWPDGTECPAGEVLIATGEDGVADTLLPRLVDHGADLTRVHFVEDFAVSNADDRGPAAVFTLADVTALDRELDRRHGVRLVVIDPVSAFVDAGQANGGARLRRFMAPLRELAARRSVAVILVAHLRKAPAPMAVHAIIGSVALAAAARVPRDINLYDPFDA
jgi:putative DNA primase/helicase